MEPMAAATRPSATRAGAYLLQPAAAKGDAFIEKSCRSPAPPMATRPAMEEEARFASPRVRRLKEAKTVLWAAGTKASRDCSCWAEDGGRRITRAKMRKVNRRWRPRAIGGEEEKNCRLFVLPSRWWSRRVGGLLLLVIVETIKSGIRDIGGADNGKTEQSKRYRRS